MPIMQDFGKPAGYGKHLLLFSQADSYGNTLVITRYNEGTFYSV